MRPHPVAVRLTLDPSPPDGADLAEFHLLGLGRHWLITPDGAARPARPHRRRSGLYILDDHAPPARRPAWWPRWHDRLTAVDQDPAPTVGEQLARGRWL